MDHDEWQDICKAFREEEEEEKFIRMTNKSKSKTRHKKNRRAKLVAEEKKSASKFSIIRAVKDFERSTLHRHKRSMALRGEEASTRFRRALADFRQAISEI